MRLDQQRWWIRLKFQAGRLWGLQRRGWRSFRIRGLRGTWQRLIKEFQPPMAAGSLSLQFPAQAVNANPANIVLPGHDQPPRVSIIVPVYNHCDTSLHCLAAVAAVGSAQSFEVVLVDDCSTDNTAAAMPLVGGLRYFRLADNRGFIAACNHGAAQARGEFLVFLNNDTIVQAGWLDALIDTFSDQPLTGLVGARLVYPDGRLQEAGGIVFADGSAWNYGRFDDPSDPRYTFLREVDYCSGAALAIQRELFSRLGGFDSRYAPAYYEDTDLAMRVRQAGLRVVYQPGALVVHLEGTSSGTDTHSGTKRFQTVNQEKFKERWRSALADFPPVGSDIGRARQHRQHRQVLVIDDYTPEPDQDSASVRLVNLLRILRDEDCAVTFIPDNMAWWGEYTVRLQQLGIEALWRPFVSNIIDWLEKEAHRFDTIIVCRHYILRNYLPLLRRHAPAASVVFDTVDLHFLRESRAATLAGNEALRRGAQQTRDLELELVGLADVTLVVSSYEHELLADLVPEARVEVLSNIHEVPGTRRHFAERRDVVFIGGFRHPPNVDAVRWFVSAVWPEVVASEAGIKLHIIGSKPPSELAALGQLPGVQFHGHVKDIEPYLDGCRVAVAPLRFGAGVKGKINLSMSFGQPVVATGVAIEGMHLHAEHDVLVGNDADTFARQLLRVYRDAELWSQLSQRGIDNVSRHFSFDVARAAVRRVLHKAPASELSR